MKHSLRARLGAVSMTVAFMASLLVIAAAPVVATPNNHGDTGKVSLCHATRSTSNPYVLITIDPAAIFRQGHDNHHHAEETAPVTFFELVPTPGPGDQASWDDIIPSFDYNYTTGNTNHAGTYPGKNWPADAPKWNDDRDGALAILRGLCFPGNVPDLVADLEVTKTAGTSWNRTHDWSIDKTVDPDEVWLYLPGGSGSDSATVDYKVTVTYDGYTDSDFMVTGEITIENTGDLDAEITAIDDLVGGTLAVVDCDDSLPISLALGDSITCTYELELGEAADGTNVVDVTADFYDGVVLFAGDVPFDAQAEYEFDEDPTTEVNASVDVYDDPDDDDKTLLGTLDAADFDAGDTEDFDYSKTFTHPGAQACADYTFDNEATVESDDDVLDSATASVDVHLQCEVRSGETATGFGPQWRLTKNAPNNWFMYTTWADILDGGADIIAGQHHHIGSITGVRNGTTTLTIDLDAGWYFANVSNNVKINPMSCTTNQKYVQPGQFSVKRTATANVSGAAIAVPTLTNTDCYGIHLDVYRLVPDPNFGP